MGLCSHTRPSNPGTVAGLAVRQLDTSILIEQMVVVMAGDDGDEQRTERTEHNRKGLQRSML